MPQKYIRPGEAIARRNALELAQQLGRCDALACNGWPCAQNALLLPVPNRLNEDTRLRIEDSFCEPYVVGVYNRVEGSSKASVTHVPPSRIVSDSLMADISEDDMKSRQDAFLENYARRQKSQKLSSRSVSAAAPPVDNDGFTLVVSKKAKKRDY